MRKLILLACNSNIKDYLEVLEKSISDIAPALNSFYELKKIENEQYSSSSKSKNNSLDVDESFLINMGVDKDLIEQYKDV